MEEEKAPSRIRVTKARKGSGKESAVVEARKGARKRTGLRTLKTKRGEEFKAKEWKAKSVRRRGAKRAREPEKED